MSKQKTVLVPRLRFPEFSTNWIKSLFVDVFAFHQTNTFSRNQMNNKRGYVRNIHYGDVLIKYASIINDSKKIPFINEDVDLSKFREVSYLQDGDIVIADTAEDLTAGKAVEVQNVDCDILSGLHTMLCRTKVKSAPKFWGYFLNAPIFRGSLIPLISGAKVSSISKSNILSTLVTYPDVPEQQKIADCLSSLDDLIAAEDKKLSALEAHKNGLMQKLFPAEGETVPEWRFPEFSDCGEWKATTLGKVCKFVRGPFGGALKKDIFVKKGFAVYEQQHAIYKDFNTIRYFIDDTKYAEMKRFAVKAGDIIMSCSGTMGRLAIVPDKFIEGIINQALLKLTVSKNNDVLFIFNMLKLPQNQEQILSQSGGGAIKNVASVTMLKEIKIFLPSLSEQQKISDCLSAIDTLITAESEKIETLKTHKRGLMQGLFPSVEEVVQ